MKDQKPIDKAELENMLEQLVVMKDDGELNETVQMIEEQDSAPAEEEKVSAEND